jgi:hypothetical protein
MRRDGDDRWLLAGRVVTGVASLMHVAIIVGGPELVPLFGAGERMARQAALGSPYPTIITAGIAMVLAAPEPKAFAFMAPLYVLRCEDFGTANGSPQRTQRTLKTLGFI